MIRSTITVVEAGMETEAETGVSVSDNAAQNPAPSYDFYSDALSEPVPANVIIPSDTFAIAEIVEEDGFEYQTVTINLTDEGFNPAVVIVQAGMDTEWIIDNTSLLNMNFSLLVPSYFTEVLLDSAENPLYLFPTESFDFSNKDSTAYGYVKVVDDLKMIDSDSIKLEVRNYQTMIWPPETFQSGSGASCH